MFPPLTDDLAHALTSRTHSEGVTALAATLLITYHGRILLIENSDRDGADLERWDLPATTVYPGETLTDAIDRALATAYHGLELDEITGYVGSYDRETPCGSTLIRHFAFTTEIPDPTTACRTLNRAHHWAGPRRRHPAHDRRVLHAPAQPNPPHRGSRHRSLATKTPPTSGVSTWSARAQRGRTTLTRRDRRPPSRGERCRQPSPACGPAEGGATGGLTSVTIPTSSVTYRPFDRSRNTRVLPNGSVTTATRPTGMSTGSQSTSPPAASTSRTASSAEATSQFGAYCSRVVRTISVSPPGRPTAACPISSLRHTSRCPSASR